MYPSDADTINSFIKSEFYFTPPDQLKIEKIVNKLTFFL